MFQISFGLVDKKILWKSLWLVRGFSILIIAVSFASCSAPTDKQQPAVQVHGFVNLGIDSLQEWLRTDFITAINEKNPQAIKASFLRGRILYKRIEFAVEYFMGHAARSINGPPLPEIEPEEHLVIDPGGFQVIEEYLFPIQQDDYPGLLREAKRLESMLARIKMIWETLSFRDDQVFDAVRMECFRMITLGITGFDTPISLVGINEVAQTLNTVRDVLEYYTKNSKLSRLFDESIAYTRKNIGFDDFDRMFFIRQYINPITSEIVSLQKSLKIPFIKSAYGLSGDAKTLFDSSAFNLNYFSPDANSHITNEKKGLGRKLFYDVVLSGNKTISCASCHKPELAFSDGLTKSKALAGKGFLNRNTPSLLNAGLQKGQFYDMRSLFLEDQAKDVIQNKDEIHGDLANSARELNRDTAYRKLFAEAFPNSPDSVTERSIQVVLSCYIRSLTSLNSRFDQHISSRNSSLTDTEIKGFNLFMGKAKCGICHFMPLFNGTVPPGFTFTESEVIGVPKDVEGSGIDADPGRYGIHKIENFKHAFKTPSVRNTELTAPYMHNGVYRTLKEVVEFYNRGGGKGLGFPVENQTLPFDSLKLSDAEQQSIVAFMKSLTDITSR